MGVGRSFDKFYLVSRIVARGYFFLNLTEGKKKKISDVA